MQILENAKHIHDGERYLPHTVCVFFLSLRYGFLGNNGSGKSTLLRFLAQKPCKLPVYVAFASLLPILFY